MIDEARTLEIYGYTSDDYGQGSHKPVIAVCIECGKVRSIEKRHYSELCFACALRAPERCHKLSIANSGTNNSMYGKSPSSETREKIGAASRAMWCNPDRHKKHSNRMTGNKYREGLKHTPETKSKMSAYRIGTRLGEHHPMWKEKVVKTCETCGKEFSVTPAQSHREFCSHECYNKWQVANRSGENSPFFGKTPSLEARKRISAAMQGVPYDEWESFAVDSPYCPKFNEACRESNREKYDRRCFLSDATEADNGQKLSVHHYDMNKAQGCDGHAWKLVPLCKKLHSTSHTPTWTARIIYLLEHVWNPGRNNVVS